MPSSVSKHDAAPAEFRPKRGLRNAHAQTLAGNFLPRQSALPAAEERVFQVHPEEGAQVLCHCHWQPAGNGEGNKKQDALVGYSMGGNLVMKLAGEWGRKENAPKELVAVAGVSPAMDLAPSADALHELQNRIYEWKFLRGLRRRYKRKAELFPERYDPTH